MLPVGWYFKMLNSLSPHNLLPHGFSFLKVLFWNSILSILWEFHTANFYQIHPLSPTPSISTPIFPLLSCEFSFSFIFPLSPVYVGQLLLRGTCPGVWSTFLEGGVTEENWLPLSQTLSNSSSARDGMCACLHNSMLGWSWGFCKSCACFHKYLTQSSYFTGLKNDIESTLIIFQHSCRI